MSKYRVFSGPYLDTFLLAFSYVQRNKRLIKVACSTLECESYLVLIIYPIRLTGNYVALPSFLKTEIVEKIGPKFFKIMRNEETATSLNETLWNWVTQGETVRIKSFTSSCLKPPFPNLLGRGWKGLLLWNSPYSPRDYCLWFTLFHLQSFSCFETFCCFTKFSFHHK